MLDMNTVKQIIKKELENSDYMYSVEENDSKTSQSCYYSIQGSSGVKMLFRVSDHKTYKNIMTLRIDKKLNKKQVQQFVRNRIKDLKQRTLRVLLNQNSL